jgi:hypothetical protein
MQQVIIRLTPDETALLYHAYINGLQVGSPKVRQTLAIKIERAHAEAQAIRAEARTTITTDYVTEKPRGEEASAA